MFPPTVFPHRFVLKTGAGKDASDRENESRITTAEGRTAPNLVENQAGLLPGSVAHALFKPNGRIERETFSGYFVIGCWKCPEGAICMRRQKFATPVGVERSDKILTILGALILLGGAYVAWNLGANDGANSMGTAVGAGVRTMREAVLIVGVFGLLGAVTMGSGVIKTIGRGIVPLDTIDPHIATLIALAAMFAAGLWLTLATYLRLPVSTTHSTVGAVAGAGVAVGDVPVIWARFGDIFIAWIATPIGAAVLAFLLYTLMNKLLSRFSVSNRVWAWLLTLSGIYMAFSWGANDVANATGVIVGAGLLEAN